MTRLAKDVALRRLQELSDDLTKNQSRRLGAIANLLDESGRARRADVLMVLGPEATAGTLRQFRSEVRKAAAGSGRAFALEADARATGWCWFEGSDPVVEELADRSLRESSRGIPAYPVQSAAAEAYRGVRVYVSWDQHGPGSTPALVTEFLRQLTEKLSARTDYAFTITSPADVRLGQDTINTCQDLLDAANVIITLVSPSYLVGCFGELARICASGTTRLDVVLEPLPAGPLTLGCLLLEELSGAGRAFSERPKREKEALVADVCAGLTRVLNQGEQASYRGLSTSVVEDWARRSAARRLDPTHRLVDAYAGESRFAETDLIDTAAARRLGEPVPAVERLTQWALDDGRQAPRMCALLGDLGMGKTTTTKLLTRHLLRLRREGSQAPLPLLFDLRDLAVKRLPNLNLRTVLGALLDATEFVGYRPSVQDLLTLIRSQDCLVIFDGLDEVLVHLSPAEGQELTRTLWRASQPATLPRDASSRESFDEPQRRPGSKLLLSCRTHYFRSLRDEVSHFTGQDRETATAHDYLLLLMLPFTEEQIRTYLRDNVPGADPARILDLLASVHNLRELAERPLTLAMIVDQLDVIEHAKLAGHAMRAVDLYAGIVQRWLSRDEGKHTLLPEHKVILMRELAARLWRAQRRAWSTTDVEQWLLEFLDDRPDLELHYERRLPELWKEDLRTATFLSRREEQFQFAHTSLLEYFLACYLMDALLDAHTKGRWDMPIPSAETLNFLGQLLSGLPSADQARALSNLTIMGREGSLACRTLVFAYTVAAHTSTHPLPSLRALNLSGADLRGWDIGSCERALDLPDLRLVGARLDDAHLYNVRMNRVDATAASLRRTYLQDCTLQDAALTDADLAGTTFRRVNLGTVRFDGSNPYRAQAIFCQHAPAGPGWLYAPDSNASPRDDAPRTLTGHTGRILAVAYHPQGTHLATAGEDGTARIWDATTGEPTLTLTGHPGPIQAVAYHPQGTHLATAGEDGTARIWDATTGEPTLTLTGHPGPIQAVAYHPQGTHLATAGEDGTARIWDATTGEPTLTLTGHPGPIRAVAYHPQGTHLATAGEDGTARIWDATTGEPTQTLTGHPGPIWALAYHPQGTHLATASIDGTIRIWDATTGQPTQTLTGHPGPIWALAYHPQGTHLATAGRDGTIRIWDATTGEPTLTLTGHTGPIRAVAYHPQGTHLATASIDGTARIWDATTGEPTLTLTGHTGPIWALAYHPQGTHLATAGEDGTARIWDATTGEPTLTLTGHTGPIWALAYHPQGTHLATAGEDGTARIWDATTGEPNQTLTGHTGPIRAVAYHPQGTHLATAGRDGTIRIWDGTTGEPTLTLTGHTGPIWALAYHPQGTHLATASIDGTIRIWDATTGEPTQTLTGHTGPIWALAYHPQGTHLATAGRDGTVRIWDATTGEPTLTLTGHTGPIQALAYHPQGTHLATAGEDGTARIWDGTTGEPTLTLTGHPGWIWALAYHPQGTHLSTAGRDGTARIWDATTGEQCAIQVESLPGGEVVVRDGATGRVLGASSQAWQWLGYPSIREGKPVRLPAETYGPLPLLTIN